MWNISFDIVYKNKEYNLKYDLIWEYQIYNILPLFLIGVELWIKIEEVIKLSKNIFAPEWRWTILKWINDSLIIDWSYNGWYKSISEWLKYLGNIADDYIKIAFLWDMRELWEKEEELHNHIIDEIINLKLDYIILVWKLFEKYTYEKLLKNLWNNKIYYFLDSRKAGEKINELLKITKKKSIIFAKWSQNTIFLEEWIKEFCLEKENIKLVRQSESWQKIKKKFFT